jgi:hypothetical protein
MRVLTMWRRPVRGLSGRQPCLRPLVFGSGMGIADKSAAVYG